ncbi:DUF6221 family protein [Micromonospora aurantiaca (nom. illeg.)]|uniref:DUF6221 family protein n=1 Tax=Micromonospora aurantiaca (nom. illeg.) TaxID=47850 RepID=UPI003411D9AF
MDDLVTWLGQQLDVDEQTATDRGRLAGDVWSAVEVAPGRWEVVGAGGRGVVAQGLPRWEAEHIARHDPAQTLAEVEAKRRLLLQFELRGNVVRGTVQPSTGGVWDDLLRMLALPYADRPGYRNEWQP